MNENIFRNFIKQKTTEDKAHDIAHIERVVRNAKKIAIREKASLEIVIPAAWLHDCVIVPKNSPDRSKASFMAAQKAIRFLKEIAYPHQEAIAHAIEAHSFSANIETNTLEAKVVQDADRLDAIGAIGLARCFITGASLHLDIYNLDDPFCENREPDDSCYVIDHFYCKLLQLQQQMKTKTGQEIAKERSLFLQQYLAQLKLEVE